MKHIHGCLVYFEEDTIEDLKEKDSMSLNLNKQGNEFIRVSKWIVPGN